MLNHSQRVLPPLLTLTRMLLHLHKQLDTCTNTERKYLLALTKEYSMQEKHMPLDNKTSEDTFNDCLCSILPYELPVRMTTDTLPQPVIEKNNKLV